MRTLGNSVSSKRIGSLKSFGTHGGIASEKVSDKLRSKGLGKSKLHSH